MVNNNRKHSCFFLIAAFFSSAVCAENSADKLTPLLSAYLANDIQLQKLAATVEQAKLTYDSTGISEGFSIKLATGTMVFTDSKVSMSPSVKASLPAASNLAVSFTSEIFRKDDGSTETKDKSVAFSADIISGTMKSRKVTLLKAERSLTEARRSLQNRGLTVEKAFYTELKTLYTTASEIVQAQKDLYDDKISFEEIKAKGYSKTSSKYRAAEMEVVSDEHTVETKKRDFNHDAAVFAERCSKKYDSTLLPSEFLPAVIPIVTPVDVSLFDRDTYAETEAAQWTAYINQLARDSSGIFTLSGNAGYTFDNSNTNSDSADFGTSLTWSGLSIGAGYSLPVDGGSGTSPAYTFSLSVDPSQFFQTRITEKQNSLAAKQEQLTIQNAQNDYDTAIVSQQSSLSDIQWKKKTNSESYKLYSELEADDASWYKSGIITESEWLSAQVNKENYRLQCLINDIELIIYNDETKLLFCRDGEIQ